MWATLGDGQPVANALNWQAGDEQKTYLDWHCPYWRRGRRGRRCVIAAFAPRAARAQGGRRRGAKRTSRGRRALRHVAVAPGDRQATRRAVRRALLGATGTRAPTGGRSAAEAGRAAPSLS